jgi:uncharacterized protein (TIGR03086 family)
MNGVVALELSFERLGALVTSVCREQLALPSTCERWSVKATLNHVICASWMYTMANQGKCIETEIGDLVGETPRRALAQAAEVNVASWTMPGALDGERTCPIGTFAADDALWLNVGEIAVHTWDLAKATHQDSTLDRGVVASLFNFYRSLPMDEYRALGTFGAAVPVAESAPAQDQLLAFIGRQP